MNEEDRLSGLPLTEEEEEKLFNWAKGPKVEPKVKILNPAPIWSRFLEGLCSGDYNEVVSVPEGLKINKKRLVKSIQLQPIHHYSDEPVRDPKRDRFIIKIGSHEARCFRGMRTHSVFVERWNFNNHELTEFLFNLVF